jgi:acetoin utilization deacetylase AcuC-like enzyme
MKIFHDPVTLEHRTKELLGAKVIDALESPERLEAILKALATVPEKHEVINVSYEALDAPSKSHIRHLMHLSHDKGYVEHLEKAHAQWVGADLINEDESILPECFRIPSESRSVDGKQVRPPPPSDIYARPGYYSFDMSTGIAKGTWPAILASVNIVTEAMGEILPGLELHSDSKVEGKENTDQGDGRDHETAGVKKVKGKTVLALCRPPGHHCNTHMAGGYCYVNNAVLAVDELRIRTLALDPRGETKEAVLDARLTSVAILDIDFHHGNGTQDAFYTSSEILYVSIHGENEYPYYSGKEDEIGLGHGHGFNCNFPLEPGATFEQYMEKLQLALGEIQMFQPDVLLISLGFDTYHLDPLGKFQIETEHYAKIAKAIRSTKGLQSVPVMILLEGGYVIKDLGANLLSFLDGWEEAEEEYDGALVEADKKGSQQEGNA